MSKTALAHSTLFCTLRCCCCRCNLRTPHHPPMQLSSWNPYSWAAGTTWTAAHPPAIYVNVDLAPCPCAGLWVQTLDIQFLQFSCSLWNLVAIGPPAREGFWTKGVRKGPVSRLFVFSCFGAGIAGNADFLVSGIL